MICVELKRFAAADYVIDGCFCRLEGLGNDNCAVRFVETTVSAIQKTNHFGIFSIF